MTRAGGPPQGVARGEDSGVGGGCKRAFWAVLPAGRATADSFGTFNFFVETEYRTHLPSSQSHRFEGDGQCEEVSDAEATFIASGRDHRRVRRRHGLRGRPTVSRPSRTQPTGPEPRHHGARRAVHRRCRHNASRGGTGVVDETRGRHPMTKKPAPVIRGRVYCGSWTPVTSHERVNESKACDPREVRGIVRGEGHVVYERGGRRERITKGHAPLPPKRGGPFDDRRGHRNHVGGGEELPEGDFIVEVMKESTRSCFECNARSCWMAMTRALRTSEVIIWSTLPHQSASPAYRSCEWHEHWQSILVT